MKVSYAEYQKHQEKVSGFTNPLPSYVPTPDEIERLISYTERPRLYLQSVPPDNGIKYEYENKIKFVQGSRIGEPCIDEKNVCMYMLFLLKTAKPEDEEGKKNLEYIDKRLKSMLIIKNPDEEEEK